LEELLNTPLEETSFTARGENKAAGAEAAAAAMVTEDAIATQKSSLRVQKREEKISASAECVLGQVMGNSEFLLFYFKCIICS
jgi:hypothetical protein